MKTNIIYTLLCPFHVYNKYNLKNKTKQLYSFKILTYSHTLSVSYEIHYVNVSSLVVVFFQQNKTEVATKSKPNAE